MYLKLDDKNPSPEKEGFINPQLFQVALSLNINTNENKVHYHCSVQSIDADLRVRLGSFRKAKDTKSLMTSLGFPLNRTEETTTQVTLAGSIGRPAKEMEVDSAELMKANCQIL